MAHIDHAWPGPCFPRRPQVKQPSSFRGLLHMTKTSGRSATGGINTGGMLVGAGFKPALSQILRAGPMIPRISGEPRLPEEGGFETRPYKRHDLRASPRSCPSRLSLWGAYAICDSPARFAEEGLTAEVRRGRIGRRSLPCSRLPRSPARTSPSRPRRHRLPRRRGAASANRR
jgi:hypothetical protein